MRTWLASAAVAVAAVACTNLPNGSGGARPGADVDLVKVSDVQWEQLNPARGDQSPKAGTLWGDRKGIVPTGYLIRFEDGFSSPPHIHNVSYRGVVLSGLVHNDDPQAAHMWMPPGSFWTQPKGEVHITAAKGRDSMAYIEIDQGPYLVLPTVRAFDSGERPVNIDASNIVWLDAGGQAQLSYVWGKPASGELHGALVKLPRGFDGTIRTDGPSLKVVVIRGRVHYGAGVDGASVADAEQLDPGSYFGAEGASEHRVRADADTDVTLYVRARGRFEVIAR